jgi:hypothetical protein
VFGRSQNKPVTETAPALAAAVPEIPNLEERRAACQAGLDTIQKRLDETDCVVRELQSQVSKNVRLGHTIKATDKMAIALSEARDHAKELLAARDEKAAELDGITRQILSKACGPLMIELHAHVRAAAALFAQALEPNARAHACVQQLQELGAEIPEVFIRGLSIATMAPTDYSRFCDACAQADIEIERPADDIPSIPPPASFYFRQHDDASHMMRLASNAAGNTAAVAQQAREAGIVHGFRAGRGL